MGDLRGAALPRNLACTLVAVLCLTSFPTDGSSSEPREESDPIKPIGGRMSNSVSIVSGNPNDTMVHDRSAVLHGGNLQILSMVGESGGLNVRNVRLVKLIDADITQFNLPGWFRRSNEIGPIDVGRQG
jgi:hypothetical protein